MYEDYSITHDEHKILQFNVTDSRILQVPYYLTALPILANGLLLKNDLPLNESANAWEYPVLSQLLIFRPVLS